MGDWINTSYVKPPENVVVETKIDDENGIRNHRLLKRVGCLYFLVDDSMYMYYTPTHWRRICP